LIRGAESRVPATALAFSPDGKRLLVGAHGQVRVYSVDSGGLETSVACEFPKISAFAFSSDASAVFVSGGTPGVSGGVTVLEWPNAKVVGQLTNHTDQATAVAFNSAATLLASAGADGLVQVFHWPEKARAYRLDGHSGPVLAAAFSPDDELLVTASADRSIKVWAAPSGKLRHSFSHHTDIVHCLAFRRQKTNADEPAPVFCASGSQDKTVRVWQPGIGRMVRIIRGHEGPIFTVEYSPDGARLYSAGQEGIVRVIDAESDQILLAWPAHGDWIYSLAVSPGGRVLATGDWKGIVKLWDVREADAKLKKVIQ